MTTVMCPNCHTRYSEVPKNIAADYTYDGVFTSDVIAEFMCPRCRTTLQIRVPTEQLKV